jgi:hypothetical protein
VRESPIKSGGLIYLRANEFVTCEDIAGFHRRGGRAPKLRGGKLFLFWGVVMAVGWLCLFLVLSPLVQLLENLWKRIF